MRHTDKKDRFRAVLNSYGADPEKWPEDEREGLARLLQSDDPKVRASLQDAREIDLVLALAPEAEVPAGAMNRVMAKVANAPTGEVVDLGAARVLKDGQRRGFDFRRAVPVGIAMAASLMLGVLAGLSELTATYVPGTSGITLAGLDEDTAAESLLSFEAFTLVEGDVE